VNKGDLVRMNGKYIVPNEYKNKVFVVSSEPYHSCGCEYVRLQGLPFGFATDGLEVIDV